MYKLIGLFILVFALLFSLGAGFAMVQNSQTKPFHKKLASTPTPTEPPIVLNADKLLKIVNDWRISENRQPYIKNDQLCSIAKDRVENDFKDGINFENHDGLYRKYSNYPSVLQENLTAAYTEENALKNWLNSPAHAATLRKSYKYSCIACKDNYCSQVFSNLENGTL